MPIIHRCREGEGQQPGINVVTVSDGGFAVRVWVWRISVYFRRRGAGNPARPRHYVRWEFGRTYAETKVAYERFGRGLI